MKTVLKFLGLILKQSEAIEWFFYGYIVDSWNKATVDIEKPVRELESGDDMAWEDSLGCTA